MLNGLLNHESAYLVFIYLKMRAFKFRRPDKYAPTDYFQVRGSCFETTSDTFCVIIPYGPLLLGPSALSAKSRERFESPFVSTLIFGIRMKRDSFASKIYS